MTFNIYTKTGDKGTTALIGGTRVSKDNIRIEAYGTVDELNSSIGIIHALSEDSDTKASLLRVQHDLFVIGSMLATDPDKDVKMTLPDILEDDITRLERMIDNMESTLPMLKNFILPGGNAIAAHTHISRTICRRAERIVVHIDLNVSPVNPLIMQYLNRLSDYLFVLARHFIHRVGDQEIPWIPNPR